MGFRPTVYRFAQQFKLTGFISNTPSGVHIEVQGKNVDVLEFVKKLKTNPPILAKIDQFIATDIPIVFDEVEFAIVESVDTGFKNVEISPDIATCPDCLEDIFNPQNRRFHYPFTNCTNCGPRFSIIVDRPYDRQHTSMNTFTMCSLCQCEYEDPLDRRFHAQPNACAACGPKLHMLENDTFKTTGDLITLSAIHVENGAIGAIKGLGGFNIVCDPQNLQTIKRLREGKNRPHKAFALMMKNIEIIKQHCVVTKEHAQALQMPQAPIVLLKKKTKAFEHISPDNNYLGVMLPYTPVHHLLMEHLDLVVMTSANRADEPICIHDEDVKQLINLDIVDFALSNNRPIVHRCDDSIIQVIDKQKQFIRRSRGFVPSPLKVPGTFCGPSLSLGANMKNTFALQADNQVYLSQHIGELVDTRNYNFQKSQILDLANLLEVDHHNDTHCDAHPGYENFNKDFKQIYHHHAHMLSVMGEHQLLGKQVVGVICDGVGFGSDGNIWGFEFLVTPEDDHRDFIRVGHLKNFHLPGGDQATFEIDRIAISLALNNINALPVYFPSARSQMIATLIEKKLNAPLCSSLGRLFDGVASLLGLKNRVSYEAQAAMLLQRSAENISNNHLFEIDKYSTIIENHGGVQVIDYHSMIIEVLKDLENGINTDVIAYKFHVWIVDSIVTMLKKLGPTPVVFSGGCFQNALLTRLLSDAVDDLEVPYFFNHEVPCNDGGISFGQALV